MRTQMTRPTSFQREVDRFLRDAFAPVDGDRVTGRATTWLPAMDVRETEDGFTLHVELPGVAPEAVEVTLEDDVLTVAGERAAPEADESVLRIAERRYGSFHRSLRLPDRVDGGRVTATHADGVLTVEVPKAEEAKPRRIDVTAG